MLQMKVSFWAFAAVGIAVVVLLFMYVSAKFEETNAYDNELYTGLYLDDTKPPTILTSTEQKRIDEWIKKNNLNQYGDAKDTVYKYGPLKSQNGQNEYKSRFQYILAQHLDKPWNVGSKEADQENIDKWIAQQGLNQYGDSKDTGYAGGTPLFNETTGKSTDRYDYIRAHHSDKPWNSIK